MPIERFWPEVNNRVNYPIKQILTQMDNDEIIDMSDETVKYCVSAVTCIVSSYGMQQVVSSWNMHPIASIHNTFTIQFQFQPLERLLIL